MPDQEEDAVDKLHEEIYGKTPNALVTPYVDDDESAAGDVTPPAASITPPAPDSFEHKYNVLQGKYNKEMGRMNTMLSSVLTEKEQLQAQLNAAPASANPFSDDTVIAGDQDIEFLKAQYPDAYPGIEALVAKRTAEIVKPVADTVATTAATTARIDGDRYFETLDSKIKDWRTINNSPEFIEWLNARDRYTGATKHQLLRDAFYKRDVERSASFFDDYIKETAAVPPPGQNPAAPTPPVQFRQFVDTDAYPNNSGSPTPSISEKGIVHRSDIDRFYKDRATGRFIGTEEDAAKIESRFFRAIKEGKVR
jgi:hypothetical protein